jgi:hypothetical protein
MLSYLKNITNNIPLCGIQEVPLVGLLLSKSAVADSKEVPVELESIASRIEQRNEAERLCPSNFSNLTYTLGDKVDTINESIDCPQNTTPKQDSVQVPNKKFYKLKLIDKEYLLDEKFYKLKLIDKEYLLDEKSIKYFSSIHNKINNDDFIFISEINSKNMDLIIVALNYINMHGNFENFNFDENDIIMDKITVDLIYAVDFLGFQEFYNKIFEPIKYFIEKSLVIYSMNIVHNEYHNIVFDGFLDNDKYSISFRLLTKWVGEICDQKIIKCFLNDILPIPLIKFNQYKNMGKIQNIKTNIKDSIGKKINNIQAQFLYLYLFVETGSSTNGYIFGENNNYFFVAH